MPCKKKKMMMNDISHGTLVEASNKALTFLHVLSESVYQHGSNFCQDYERIVDNLTEALARTHE